MRILVACEESQAVTRELRRLGHEAYSCDIEQKRKDGRQQKSIEFFMMFANCGCPKTAIENPIGIMSGIYRKPDQIIQPWQFGHGETKRTCLWLKGLPKLKPVDIVPGREQRIWKMPPGKDWA